MVCCSWLVYYPKRKAEGSRFSINFLALTHHAFTKHIHTHYIHTYIKLRDLELVAGVGGMLLGVKGAAGRAGKCKRAGRPGPVCAAWLASSVCVYMLAMLPAVPCGSSVCEKRLVVVMACVCG